MACRRIEYPGYRGADTRQRLPRPSRRGAGSGRDELIARTRHLILLLDQARRAPWRPEP
ncbi:MAG TPA: hypothetical protein VNM90_15245 [Haliangium sp.]|nr:hypothetical protein [Haliangium sp.]